MKNLLVLKIHIDKFQALSLNILSKWVNSLEVTRVLLRHNIDKEVFVSVYASNIFKYFVDVISGIVQIGACPVMVDLLIYLKDKDITTQELFIICSHFKLSMIDVSYDLNINSRELLNEINYVFDKNFTSVLKQYSQTIYEKDIEIDKNVKLLEQYMEALNQSALISKTDEDGNITLINDKFIKLCGYDRAEFIGKTHKIIRDKDTPNKVYKELWNTIKNGRIFRAIIRNIKKDGKYFYIDTTIIPIENPFTQLKEYIAIGYEVTRLIDAKQKAIDADKAKDYFLSNMSHEIRTPLNAILGFVTLLKDNLISKEQNDYLNIIHNSGENLLSLINDILDFSKLRSGEFTVENKVFNLEDILSHTIELFVAWANDKNISISSYIDPLMPSKILSDSLRIQQIISNFINNAIKFTSSLGNIEVKATISHKNILTIAVKDSGIGISTKDIDKIFQPFAQIQNNEILSSGTGLGLSICKQLANLLGGTISLKSKQKKGSTFTLAIPIQIVDVNPRVLRHKLFKNKMIALLITDKTSDKKLNILKKYCQYLDISLHVIRDIDEISYDLLYFYDNDLSNSLRYQIIQNNKPAVCITETLNSHYNFTTKITTLNFPLYSKKLQDITLNALNSQKDMQIKIQHNTKKQFKAHVLIAEDNEANQELIKAILKKYAITCDVVNNGIDAFNMYKKNKYHLILMDEQMPIKNGYSTTKDILTFEKKFNKQHTPIIALTANVLKNSKIQSIRLICDDFLGKPIILDKLEKIFLKYLNSSTHAIDISTLEGELQLNKEELLILLRLYIKKVDESLSLLKQAIINLKFKKIVKLAHSIKGASANFRFFYIQNDATKLETAALHKDQDFSYDLVLKDIIFQYKKIKEALTRYKN